MQVRKCFPPLETAKARTVNASPAGLPEKAKTGSPQFIRRPGAGLTGFHSRPRMENLRGAFRVPHTADVTGRQLILINDLSIAGSAMEECARPLLAGGASALPPARG
jgi:hypothetical protein